MFRKPINGLHIFGKHAHRDQAFPAALKLFGLPHEILHSTSKNVLQSQNPCITSDPVSRCRYGLDSGQTKKGSFASCRMAVLAPSPSILPGPPAARSVNSHEREARQQDHRNMAVQRRNRLGLLRGGVVMSIVATTPYLNLHPRTEEQARMDIEKQREQDRRDSARSGSRDSTRARWNARSAEFLEFARNDLRSAFGQACFAVHHVDNGIGGDIADILKGIADLMSDVEVVMKRLGEQ